MIVFARPGAVVGITAHWLFAARSNQLGTIYGYHGRHMKRLGAAAVADGSVGKMGHEL
jgi:hypothetical protein